ncbi:hypothetical protein D9M71_802110 [compost metagenome]
MGACSRNQQRTLGGLLPLYLVQVGVGFAGVNQAIGDIGFDWRVPVEMGDGFQQMIHRNHLQAGRQARLLGIRPRHHQRTPGLARRQCRRQDAAHGTHRA